MKKILINALSARLGGGQTYILNFLSHIDSENEYTFLVGPYNRELFEKEAEGKTNVHFRDCGVRQVNPLFRLFWEYFALSRFLRKSKPDVYYAAGGGTLAQVPKGTCSALIIRNMLPFDQKERKRFPFFSLARLKLRLLRSIAVYALRRADKVIFISEYSRDTAEKWVPGSAKKGKVIPHGLDKRFLSPLNHHFDFSRFGLTQGSFYLYVSIFNHYKGQAELVREWEILTSKGFPYRLVLTGFLPPGYSDTVKRLITEKNLQEQIIVTGPLPYRELPSYYPGARALIFASSCECCPNILLEKMAAGKPLFCSKYPPMPEFGGENPYYFEPYQEGDLAQKILLAEKDFEEMKRRGEKNRIRAERYDWIRTVKDTIEFLTSK